MTKKENPPGDILSYGKASLKTTGTIATGILEMAYNAAEDEFDFTDFMTCKVNEIDLIAALGSDTTIALHSNKIGGKKLTRLDSCTCDMDDSSANNILNGFYLIFSVFIAFLFN